MSCFKLGDTLPKSAVGGGTSVKIVPPKDPEKGGVQPDIIVQFRPNKDYLGKFGFDWLRLGDSKQTLTESDVKYTENVGYHYDDSDSRVGIRYQMKSFKKESKLAEKLKKSFKLEGNLTNLSTQVTGLDKNFDYRIPVMTLMPKDKILNPHNVNLVAKLDTFIHTGDKKAKSLRLAYKSNDEEDAAKDVIVVNSMSLPNSSEEGAVSITSKGILKRSVTLYVYADKCHQPCGAIKILRNDKVKQVTSVYIGVATNINTKDEKTKNVPKINFNELRAKVGQALVSVNIINFPKLLDMKNKFTSKNQYLVKNSKGATINTLLNFDSGLLSSMDKELYKQIKSEGLPIPKGEVFKLYFLEDGAYSPKFKINAGGGGAVGGKSSMFFGDNGNSVGILAHELGHNLKLRHTFSHKSDYTYEYKSTDNIMDYTHKDIVYYHWQWKIMNPKGIES